MWNKETHVLWVQFWHPWSSTGCPFHSFHFYTTFKFKGTPEHSLMASPVISFSLIALTIMKRLRTSKVKLSRLEIRLELDIYTQLWNHHLCKMSKGNLTIHAATAELLIIHCPLYPQWFHLTVLPWIPSCFSPQIQFARENTVSYAFNHHQARPNTLL